MDFTSWPNEHPPHLAVVGSLYFSQSGSDVAPYASPRNLCSIMRGLSGGLPFQFFNPQGC
jgi:hypothetical protein